MSVSEATCKHSWKFDGDDPYLICHYCGQINDAITGAVVRASGSQGGE